MSPGTHGSGAGGSIVRTPTQHRVRLGVPSLEHPAQGTLHALTIHYGSDQEEVTGHVPTCDTGDKLAPLRGPARTMCSHGARAQHSWCSSWCISLALNTCAWALLLDSTLLPGTKVTCPRTSVASSSGPLGMTEPDQKEPLLCCSLSLQGNATFS